MAMTLSGAIRVKLFLFPEASPVQQACTLRLHARQAALPHRYRLMTFEAFRVEPGMRELFEVMQRFASNPWKQGWC